MPGYTTSAQVLTDQTTTTAVPSAVTDGVALNDLGCPDEMIFLLKSTAGSGTMNATVRFWGYVSAASAWLPLGTATTADNKGVGNEQSSIAETGTDSIRHAELLSRLRHLDRLYVQVTVINGTSTTLQGWLFADVRRGG